MPNIRTLSDVVRWRLCLGCGACAYASQGRVRLHDYDDQGIRPMAAERLTPQQEAACLEICPVVHAPFPSPAATHEPQSEKTELGLSAQDHRAFESDWGPVLAIWEGHASDPEIRFEGSSGGALTALALYCVEKGGMHGVLHTGADPEDPLRNRTRLSTSRDAIRRAAGSRYSPASVADGLGLVETAPAPCAIIGKPVEIAAVRNAQRMNGLLSDRVGITMSFFCAETPATNGTVSLLQREKVAPASVANLRYRGLGWPGHFMPVAQGDSKPACKLTYRESWSYLQRFRPWGTHLWPDGSGELADISCGDPWYEEPDGVNPGFSLIVARTPRGRHLVEEAIRAGYLNVRRAEPWKLAKSQSGLLAKKGAVWGRRLATRMLNLPVTDLSALDLRHCWKPLSLAEKARATLGTLRRCVERKLYRPLVLDASKARPVGSPYVAGQERTDQSAPR